MVAADEREIRVVPAPPQVVAGFLMRRTDHPTRRRQAVRAPPACAVDIPRDLFPVGLVLVPPAERRPPVVEAVEEPVLTHDPRVIAQHPAVVGQALRRQVVTLEQERVCRATAWDAAAEEQ